MDPRDPGDTGIEGSSGEESSGEESSGFGNRRRSLQDWYYYETYPYEYYEYDMWSYNTCSEECTEEMLGDGICQDVCNTQGCGYDSSETNIYDCCGYGYYGYYRYGYYYGYGYYYEEALLCAQVYPSTSTYFYVLSTLS